MASINKYSTPPKNIQELIELSRLFILNNYGKSIKQDVQQKFYNKIQKCLTEISVELNLEMKKAKLEKLEMEEKKHEQRKKVLEKLENEHASDYFRGGKKKSKSRRHKKKKRNKTIRKYT